MRRRSPYNFKEIQVNQQILDESDPFLVEILLAKDDQELAEYAQNFEQKYDMAMQSRNVNTRRNATETRKTIHAMLEVRRLTALLDRVEKSEDDGFGGTTLS